jgi:hypothetical protein
MLVMEHEGEPLGNLSSYEDAPHPIGYNQTISAPHMVKYPSFHTISQDDCLNVIYCDVLILSI